MATLASLMFWNIPGDACALAFLGLLYASPQKSHSEALLKVPSQGGRGSSQGHCHSAGWAWGAMLPASSGRRLVVPLNTPSTVPMPPRQRPIWPQTSRGGDLLRDRWGGLVWFVAVSRCLEQRQARRRHAVGRGHLGSQGWGSRVYD